ncbi:MAG: DUF541 domain-containing protein [Alphaproteobacteria bacterium]|nr:DUF541 domain-containing protein [Alphaproteobacteria bacterium]
MLRFLLVIAFLAISGPVSAQEALDTRTKLHISAQSEVTGKPDLALISAGIVTQNIAADAALAENSTKMNAVFEAIKKAGIEEKDIQTSGININPQYVYGENVPPKISGYQVSNSVSIKIRDLKKIGKTLDALVAQGANQINGPSFSIENPDPLLDNARSDAVAKARKKAELYAKAAGMKVKKILSISEAGGYMEPPRPMMEMAMAKMDMRAASTPVAIGELNMTASVQMVFELE